MRASWAVTATFLLTACGDSRSDQDASLDAAPITHAPSTHKPSPDACSHDRPVFIAGSDAGAGDAATESGSGLQTCSSDQDCTSTPNNGRCGYIWYRDAGPSCTYDECFSDSDCKLGVCNCRQDPTHDDDSFGSGPHPNYCMAAGNCRVDSDCGDGGAGYCSPSPNGGCRGFWLGYFCHTASDQCVDDSDCAKGSLCAYTGTLWACTPAVSCLDGG